MSGIMSYQEMSAFVLLRIAEKQCGSGCLMHSGRGKAFLHYIVFFQHFEKRWDRLVPVIEALRKGVGTEAFGWVTHPETGWQPNVTKFLKYIKIQLKHAKNPQKFPPLITARSRRHGRRPVVYRAKSNKGIYRQN